MDNSDQQQESKPERADAIVIHPTDNVATATRPLAPGTLARLRLGDGWVSLHVAQHIPFGHKLAIRPIPAGEDVRKYGEVIGRAATDIGPGEHVHVHNVKSLRAQVEMLTGPVKGGAPER